MKTYSIIIIFLLVHIDVDSQVPNPRIPAEWEEIQAIIMEPNLYPRKDKRWYDVIDPYIKVAEACIAENIELYLLEKESQDYSEPNYPNYKIYLDTIFSNRNIISPLIHIIKVKDDLIPATPWARDHGMFCVYEDNVGEMNMYHFEGYQTSQIVDTIFDMNSELIDTSLDDNGRKGGNFMTDGHGTFNIMHKVPLPWESNDGRPSEVVSDYHYFTKYFGIKETALITEGHYHIDMSIRMLNEETMIVSSFKRDLVVSFIKENLLSVFGRELNIIPIDNAWDDFKPGEDKTNYRESYTNALILNSTILVPQYGIEYFDYKPLQDSLALEAYKKAMPGYNVIGVNCSEYILHGGALHCITREIPAFNPIYIKHKWLKDKTKYNRNGYYLSALVQSALGIEDVKLYWREKQTDSFTEETMVLSATEDDTYHFTLDSWQIGDEIEYYITATDTKGKRISKPYVADKGPYKTRFIGLDPDVAYSQVINVILPDGTPIDKAEIDIEDNTFKSNENGTCTLDLKPGKYTFTVTAPGVLGEYKGVVDFENSVPKAINVIANPINITVKSQYGDELDEAEITLINCNDAIIKGGSYVAFEATFSYSVSHPAISSAVEGIFAVNKHSDAVQQVDLEIEIEKYRLTILPCLPDGTPVFETNISINNKEYITKPGSATQALNLLLSPDVYHFSATSANVVGEYKGEWQPNGRYADTVKVIINPIKFIAGGTVVLENESYTLDNTNYLYAFGNQIIEYNFTHPAMFGTHTGMLSIEENTYGTNYIDYVPNACAEIATLTINIDGGIPQQCRFYEERFPSMSQVLIPKDGRIYFVEAKRYDYEISAGRVMIEDTIVLEPGDNKTIDLFIAEFMPARDIPCYLNVENRILCANRACNYTQISFFHKRDYDYTLMYKDENKELIIDTGILSPLNSRIEVTDIFTPLYRIVGGDGTALAEAQLATHTGYNLYKTGDGTYGIVFKDNDAITCTVSCAGYEPQTFVAHSDDELHDIVLQPAVSTSISTAGTQDILIYPNPVTNGMLHIKADKPIESVTLYNMAGNVVLHTNEPTSQIDVSSVPGGVYLIKIGNLVKRIVIM